MSVASHGVTSWLLFGMLLASTALNARLWSRADTPRPRDSADCVSCTGVVPVDCPLNREVLRLSPAQSSRLEGCCAATCEAWDAIDRSMAATVDELQAALVAEMVDRDHVARLVASLEELRSRRLQACIDTVIDLREILSPEQLRILLSSSGDCGLDCLKR